VMCMAFLTACTRARVTTELHTDGSFTRTVVLTGQPKQEGGMQMPTLEDTFVFPAGAGWKLLDDSKKTSAVSAVQVTTSGSDPKQNDITKSFERLFAAGTSAKGDLSIKADKTGKKLQLVNEATVTQIGPNRYEYKETLRWVGDAPPQSEPAKEQLEQIKALLPKELATEANVRALVLRTNKLAVPMLFGPNDPLLATGWLHPELAERRMMQRAGGLMVKALEEQFGDNLTLEQRRELTRQAIKGTLNSSKPTQPDSAGRDKKDSSSLTPLTFVLRAPGKLISSNGEYDELSGEIFWALYPEAASLQPVVLTAVFEVK
jgi:hypothetical protein